MSGGKLWVILWPANHDRVKRLTADGYFIEDYQPSLRARVRVNRRSKRKASKRLPLLEGYAFVRPATVDWRTPVEAERMAPLEMNGETIYLTEQQMLGIKTWAEELSKAIVSRYVAERRDRRARKKEIKEPIEVGDSVAFISEHGSIFGGPMKALKIEGPSALVNMYLLGSEKKAKIPLDILARTRQDDGRTTVDQTSPLERRDASGPRDMSDGSIPPYSDLSQSPKAAENRGRHVRH